MYNFISLSALAFNDTNKFKCTLCDSHACILLLNLKEMLKVEHSDFLAKFVHLGGGGKDIMAVAGRLGSQTHRPFVSEEKKVPVDRTELLNRIRAKLQGRSEDVQKAFFEEQDHALDYKVGREEVAR
jgi:hypothetical protein